MENNTAQTKKDVSSRTSSNLRNMLRDIDFVNADAAKNRGALSARARISRLLDEGTFVEVGTYVKNRDDESFSGIICGYGALDGRLIFVFSQDHDRGYSVVDEFYTKKILTLYDMALKNGAPIVGIFDNCIEKNHKFGDITSLSGIGKIMGTVSRASGVIPQIAIMTGACDTSFSVIASMFDFVVSGSPDNYLMNENAALLCENEYTAIARTIDLIKRLPQNNVCGTVYEENNSSINRLLDVSDNTAQYDVKRIINKISDNSDFIELYSDKVNELLVGFMYIGGTSVGICANDPSFDMGLITAKAAKKAAKFISFCDSFNIPLLTLVDSVGVEKSGEASPALSSLSFAYSSSTNAKVTVVLGNAIDSAYVLMGSKSLGADVCYAIDEARITPNFGVGESDFVSEGNAAQIGEIDDIVEYSELRKKICAAFEMLSSKSTLPFSKKEQRYSLIGW